MHISISKFILLSSLVSSLLLTGCEGEHQGTQTMPVLPSVKVQTTRVEQKSPELQIEILGTVQAIHSALIATKVSGNITELSIELGSRVIKGDSLMKLDAGELSAKLLQSKAQLSQAKRNLTREQNLLKKKAATPEAVKNQQDTVSIAEAAYQEAVTMMQYTHIEAPFDGLITKKLVNLGDLVTPGLPLLQLDSDKELQIISNIPEQLLSRITLGDTFTVKIPSIDKQLTGTVSELAPTADPQSRTALMKLTVPVTPGLRPGQFSRVYLKQPGATTLTIPTSAIFKAGQLDRVFTVENGFAKLRLVRTGAEFDGFIEILSGLDAEETVVMKTESPLVDNQPLTIQ